MKSCASDIILALWIASFATAAPSEKGLVAYYNFDKPSGNSIEDVSGNGKHGTLKGARLVKAGKGFALALSSDGQCVECPVLEFTNAVTLSAWIKAAEKHGGELGIMGRGASLPDFCGLTYYKDSCWFYVSSGTNQVQTGVPRGRWHHVAATFDGKTMKLYVDGEFKKQLTSKYNSIRPAHEDKIAGGRFFIGLNNRSSFRGLIDEVRVRNRALTPGQVFQEYARSAAGIGLSVADIALKPRYSLSLNEIQVRVDCRVLGTVPEGSTIEAHLTSLGDKAAPGVTLRKTQVGIPDGDRARCAWSRANLPAIAYTLAATIKGRDGREVASWKRQFWLPPKPAWLGTREGYTHKVLPPWTPLKVTQTGDTIAIEPWGRSYQFGRSLFPTQIISQKMKLLARPIRWLADVNGKTATWETEPTVVRPETPTEVILHHKARTKDGSLTFTTMTWLEYDGMVKILWQVWPHKALQLNKLILEIPLRASVVKLKQCGKKAGIGLLQKEGIALPFQAHVWLGDEEKGLTFVTESDQLWRPASRERAVEIRREQDAVVLRLHLIEKAIQFPPSYRSSPVLAYTFGLLATPLKPMLEDGWDYRFSSHWHYGYDYGLLTDRREGKPALDYLAEKGIRTIILCNWTNWLCYPKPVGHENDLHLLVHECHKRGIKVVPYFGYQQSMLCPEWELWGGEFAQGEAGAGQGDGYGASPPRYRSQPVHQVCQSGPHQDFLVHGIARLIDEYDVDGVYLDTTGQIRPCDNGLHGCGYTTPDGRRVNTWPVFGVRRCIKRIYTVVKTRKPDGIVDLHTGGGISVPSLAWATSYFYGEQYAYLKKGTELRSVFDLPEFRTELMGHPFGVPVDFLFPYSRWLSERQALAVTLLHDVLIRPHESIPAIELTSALGRVSERFNRKHAEWLPYWRNADYVTVTPRGTDAKPGAYVSLYRHPENGVLAVISNLSSKTEDIEVRLDLTRLGLAGQKLTATEAMTEQQLPLKGGTLRFAEMPSLDWKLVWLKSADRQP